ncbi:cytochrome P450 [Acidimicrobiia bacterium EGI L10123]|uniref:cytochrome P450 n=1 Tax=Salinilacustrithrix flava TaxID=2957203 RepID=UPI003D7C3139|nr:cytochrome P450 [Acidimicrobiia bacterium EGI L10123]
MTAPQASEAPANAARLFLRGSSFLDPEGWHRSVDELRSPEPFLPVDDHVYGPLWIVTDLHVLLDVSRRPAEFANTEEPALLATAGLAGDDKDEVWGQLKMLVNMDGPDHQAHRKVVVDWFKNSTLRVLKPAVEDLVTESMARLRDLDGECDFATEIALPLPLRVIMSMLGVPREDEPVMLKLTQEMFSADDDELGSSDPLAAIHEVAGYLMDMMRDRKDNPTDDLCSAIVHGVVDGTSIETMAALGLHVIIATAGHDTTSFAMSGGVEALCRFPDEFQRLRADPSLVDNAAHEVVRLTSPVRHFLRHTQADAEVAGQAFAPGDRILLSYPAANRDPAVFDDPHRLDVGRSNANRQIGWGHGPHFCLGARLAQMEVAAILNGLAREVTSIEATGPAAWTKAHFVGGAKHVPVRGAFA